MRLIWLHTRAQISLYFSFITPLIYYVSIYQKSLSTYERTNEFLLFVTYLFSYICRANICLSSTFCPDYFFFLAYFLFLVLHWVYITFEWFYRKQSHTQWHGFPIMSRVLSNNFHLLFVFDGFENFNSCWNQLNEQGKEIAFEIGNILQFQ